MTAYDIGRYAGIQKQAASAYDLFGEAIGSKKYSRYEELLPLLTKINQGGMGGRLDWNKLKIDIPKFLKGTVYNDAGTPQNISKFKELSKLVTADMRAGAPARAAASDSYSFKQFMKPLKARAVAKVQTARNARPLTTKLMSMFKRLLKRK